MVDDDRLQLGIDIQRLGAGPAETVARVLQAAERHYTEVIAVNFDYKDAHERLTKIQGSRGGGALEGVDDL